MRQTLFAKAVSAIEKHGVLLVFPVNNRPVPRSLWSVLHPKSPMRWEWDEDGDNRVARLWHLREELSRSGQVVYTKWYQGRATFFSRDVFVAALAALGTASDSRPRLGRESAELLSTLELDSPLSTKALKRATGLTGRASEPAYERSLKALWQRLLIVSYGEVDEGAFPSLALGATRVLFEDLWTEAAALSPGDACRKLEERLGADSPFLKFFYRIRNETPRSPESKTRRRSHVPSVIEG